MQPLASIRGAVLDLGSNTFKLMLAEQRGDMLKVYFEAAYPTRLSENLAQTRKLSSAAIKRSLQTLKKCRRKINAFGASRIVAAGTNALRAASNRKEFLVSAEKILGTKIHILSGKKEAELVYAGITSNPRWKKQKILNLDIGGGSMELIGGQKGKIYSCKSLSIGSVRLRDMFLSSYPLRKASLIKAEKFLLKKLRTHLYPFLTFKGKLLSTGGTMNALCSIQSGKTNLPSLEGFCLTYSALNRIFSELILLKLDEIKEKYHLSQNRMDIIAPGALILLVTMKLLKQNQIYCSTRALRYGIWNQWIVPRSFHDVHFMLLKSAKKA